MRLEAMFYQKVQPYRVQLAGVRSDAEALQAALYIKNVLQLGEAFGIDGLPKVDIPEEVKPDTILQALYTIESFMSQIYARNIYELDQGLQKTFVEFDEKWKQKVSSYISNIREHVKKADVEEALRERIFNKLQELQREVDRNRTRTESVVDVLLVLTEATGRAAKNLKPAIALIEQMAGALSKLRNQAQQSETTLQLPLPETLGLTGPDKGNNGDEGKNN